MEDSRLNGRQLWVWSRGRCRADGVVAMYRQRSWREVASADVTNETGAGGLVSCRGETGERNVMQTSVVTKYPAEDGHYA